MHRITTIGLTAIAGFVDTLTFVSVHGLFAAHVTGNFVVFGAALAKGVQPEDYLKLIAFPVFVVAVMAGSAIYAISKKRVAWIILLQGLLFAAVALASYLNLSAIPLSVLALVLVAAMGLQNSLHRYVPGPMTTVMTGTVMNWSAALAEKLFKLPNPGAKSGMPTPFLGAFAGGCIAAGFFGQHFGLASVGIAALASIALAFFELSQNKVSAA